MKIDFQVMRFHRSSKTFPGLDASSGWSLRSSIRDSHITLFSIHHFLFCRRLETVSANHASYSIYKLAISLPIPDFLVGGNAISEKYLIKSSGIPNAGIGFYLLEPTKAEDRIALYCDKLFDEFHNHTTRSF